MHKEMSDRIREAGSYQKKAIHALFPDSTNRHLEVIEHEIKEMLTEEIVEIAGAVMQYQSGGSNGKQAENSTSNESEAQTEASNSKSKKINIE